LIEYIAHFQLVTELTNTLNRTIIQIAQNKHRQQHL